MSDFLFSSVLLGKVCKKVIIFLYSGSSKTGACQVIAALLCVQQASSSCLCCSKSQDSAVSYVLEPMQRVLELLSVLPLTPLGAT